MARRIGVDWRVAEHQGADHREQDLVRGELDQAAACARLGADGVERRRGIGILEILEDQRRIEEGEIAVDQHRDLALGIRRQHVGMLGAVAGLLRERHHHAAASRRLGSPLSG